MNVVEKPHTETQWARRFHAEKGGISVVERERGGCAWVEHHMGSSQKRKRQKR